VVGGVGLRSLAALSVPLDLGAPPPGVQVTTVVGAQALGRLCVWARSGDVDGDGIADVVVGADQEISAGETHRGAVWVLRGGAPRSSGTDSAARLRNPAPPTTTVSAPAPVRPW